MPSGPNRNDALLAQGTLARLRGDSVSLGRAIFEAGGVLRCSVDKYSGVSALVESSSSPRPRLVTGSLGAHLRCTCSWAVGCKHVAAVLHEIASGAASGWSSLQAAEARVWANRLARRSTLSDTERVVFVLDLDTPFRLRLGAQRRLVSGQLGKVVRLSRDRAAAVVDGRAGCADVADIVETLPWMDGELVLRGRMGARAVGLALDSGRLFVDALDRAAVAPVSRGPALRGVLAWSVFEEVHTPVVDLFDSEGRAASDRDDIELFPFAPLYYWHWQKNQLGIVEVSGMDVDLPLKWLAGPEVPKSEIEHVARAIALAQPRAPVPLAFTAEIVDGPPIARFTVREAPPVEPGAFPRRWGELSFRYGDAVVSGNETVVELGPARRVTVRRDLAAEARLRETLREHGFVASVGPLREPIWWLGPSRDWLLFLYEGHRELAAAGFEVVIDASVSLTVIEADDWFADLEESGRDWFELTLGAEVEGKRVSLLPALLEALRGRGAGGAPGLPARRLFVKLPDGRHAAVPRERIEPLAEILLELAAEPAGPQRKLSRLRAMDVAAVTRAEQGTLAALRVLRDELVREDRSELVLPASFHGELRPYQAAGVRWLERLRRTGIGAVLADDMGLGKTVQIIALLTLAGGGKRPSLVVAPTSVLLSWMDQLARFAPSLDVVLWHGPERGSERKRLGTADLVVTSYAIFHRDGAELVETRNWNVCVFDEAQVLKNAKTALSGRAREVQALQRIALTGTPIENHLGELWSIVSTAVPGALGSDRAFRAAYRNPIEKQADQRPLESLRRRLSPVLLRRTKEQVASELPAKTTIDHVVELEGSQRDIYEAVRQTMVRAVQQEIAEKGFARSQIMVLDALLKLRQVCCDPRLLKAASAKRTNKSAKLDAFAELVETLTSEGRRILVFSQFVSMLELIGERLDQMAIPFIKLTGETRDRRSVVDMFRKGTVPVFLISLKAGGTGLNLVEADTVIHYDPWWNPAVEAQATDRAHRIGQTKPVFVHRLLTKDTVEQKIVDLQRTKAQLARGLLEGGFEAPKLDQATVDALLAPISAAAL